MKKLVTQDDGKATGLDNITVKLLKLVALSVAPSLTSLSVQFPLSRRRLI